jgi:hypothetical protein
MDKVLPNPVDNQDPDLDRTPPPASQNNDPDLERYWGQDPSGHEEFGTEYGNPNVND